MQCGYCVRSPSSRCVVVVSSLYVMIVRRTPSLQISACAGLRTKCLCGTRAMMISLPLSAQVLIISVTYLAPMLLSLLAHVELL